MDEVVKFVKSKKVAVRKPTICFGCNREFPVGTMMDLQTMRANSLYNLHLCETCEILVDTLIPDGFIYHEGNFENITPKYKKEHN